MDFMNLEGKTIETVIKEDGQITITFIDGEKVILFTTTNEEIFIKTN